MFSPQSGDGMTSGPGTKSFTEMLNDIASRAQMFTTASGAAIALTDADKNMVTRASAGDAAPPPGTQMRLDGSFAGMARLTSKEIICEDTETDTRADARTYQAIGIRSLAMVPIIENTAVRGVLAVFGDVPGAFSRKDVAVLKTMADVVLSALQSEERTTGAAEDEPVEKASELKPPAPPEPEKSTVAFKHPAITSPPSVTVAVADSVGIQPKIAAESDLVPMAESIVPQRKVREPEPVAKHIPKKLEDSISRSNVVPISTATAPALARKPEVHIEHSPEPNPGDLLGLLRESAENRDFSPAASGGNKKPMLIAIGVVAVALIAMVGYFTLRGSSTKSQTPVAQASATQTSEQQPQQQSQVRDQTVTPSIQPPAQKKPSAQKSEKSQDAEDDASVTMVLQPPSKRSAANADTGSVEPPNIALSGGSMPALGGVPTSTPQLVHHVPVVVPPVPLQQPKPTYPEIARRLGIAQGSVVMNVHVNRDGSVGDVNVVRGERVLQPPAVAAVKRWRYKPATSDGQPIAYNVQVEMRFNAQ